jgi:hypothetical protein
MAQMCLNPLCVHLGMGELLPCSCEGISGYKFIAKPYSSCPEKKLLQSHTLDKKKRKLAKIFCHLSFNVPPENSGFWGRISSISVALAHQTHRSDCSSRTHAAGLARTMRYMASSRATDIIFGDDNYDDDYCDDDNYDDDYNVDDEEEEVGDRRMTHDEEQAVGCNSDLFGQYTVRSRASQSRPTRYGLASLAYGRPTRNPAGESSSKKAMTTADTVSSAAAMRSNETLHLYRIGSCHNCKPRWSNLPSLEAESAHIAELANGYGIFTRIDPEQANKTIQVSIQNKHMKGILTDVFAGYPEFHTSLLPEDSGWIFNEPFSMFVGRWGSLLQYSLRTPFAPEKEAWTALVETMTPIVQPTLDAIKRIKDTGLVRWRDLPLIFPPGKLIIVNEVGLVQSIGRVRAGSWSDPPGKYYLNYEYIDCDGKSQGLSTRKLVIPEYTGHKKVKVSDLTAMPLEFYPSASELRAKLVARGRLWSSLTGVQYKQFGGKKVPITTGVPIEEVSGCPPPVRFGPTHVIGC